MKHAPPAPPELGESDGLSYALFLPEGEPEVGVVILHGAGSAKESHFDFARGCRDDGMAALAFDARGHGRSEGRVRAGRASTTCWPWSTCCGRMLRRWPCAARAWAASLAIHAAARDPSICRRGGHLPRAGGAAAARRCARDGPERFALRRARPPTPGSGTLDLYDGGGRRSAGHRRCSCCTPAATSRCRTPSARSSTPPRTSPSGCSLLPGGHHRSLQHDHGAAGRVRGGSCATRRGPGLAENDSRLASLPDALARSTSSSSRSCARRCIEIGCCWRGRRHRGRLGRARRLAFYSHAVGSATFPGLVTADATGISATLLALAVALGYAGGVGAHRARAATPPRPPPRCCWWPRWRSE